MAKLSSILVAIVLSFTVVTAELPAAAPGKTFFNMCVVSAMLVDLSMTN